MRPRVERVEVVHDGCMKRCGGTDHRPWRVEYLKAAGRAQGPSYTDSPLPVMVASMRRYLLGQSFDSISEGNGLALTTDRIHMNSLGAGMIAEEIESFLLAG